MVMDYIKLLNECEEKQVKRNDMTDDDFLELRERLKSEKT